MPGPPLSVDKKALSSKLVRKSLTCFQCQMMRLLGGRHSTSYLKTAVVRRNTRLNHNDNDNDHSFCHDLP